MAHLGGAIREELRQLADREEFKDNMSVAAIVNDVVTDEVDIEHIITFLEDSCSEVHARLAAELRKVFEGVLRARLGRIDDEENGKQYELLRALIDMHNVEALGEELRGILTLNYDSFVEKAVAGFADHAVDLGIALSAPPAPRHLRLLKLHGSFEWENAWPILQRERFTLWIPPGIHKDKQRYPFNLIWGLARELLDCDVLRVVGCRLGANDWDLISLLFSTAHAHSGSREPFTIELIDAPQHAVRLSRELPYLRVQSLFELGLVGDTLLSELTGKELERYATLTPEQQQDAVAAAGIDRNWLMLWLQHRAERAVELYGSVTTPTGHFGRLLEEPY